MSLIDGIVRGDPASISRAITILESDPGGEAAGEIINSLRTSRGSAFVIGITGPPGVGKSTLIGRLCDELTSRGRTVSILAVDASSPFSGGAFLGNRIRMEEQLHRRGVFMRSMASRGSAGGLGESVWGAVRVLSAARSDYVVVETVGAGQSDVDVIGIADYVLVVVAPGFGDLVQALKAGMLEIADAFLVNKSDLPGADDLGRYLEEISGGRPVIMASAVDGRGMGELADALEAARGNAGTMRGERAAVAVRIALESLLRDEVKGLMEGTRARRMVADVAAGRISPHEAAERMLGARARENLGGAAERGRRAARRTHRPWHRPARPSCRPRVIPSPTASAQPPCSRGPRPARRRPDIYRPRAPRRRPHSSPS